MSTAFEDTFCKRVVAAASIRRSAVAMTLIASEGNQTVTFGSMLDQVRSIAYRLTQENIAFGDRVALIGENHPNWAITYLGILYRGAVVTPLDPAATTKTLATFLESSEAKLAFVSPNSTEKFRAACDLIGKSIPSVILGTALDGSQTFEEWAATPTSSEFDKSSPPAKPDDLAILIYTSGTTGIPKAVPLSHGNIYAQSTKIQEVMHLSDQEVMLSLLPLFHAYSQIVNLWLATIIGARVVYLTEVDSAQIERGLKEGGATALVGVPRLWYLFHKKIFDAVQGRAFPVRLFFRSLLVVNSWLRDWFGLNAGRFFFGRVHQSFGGRLRLAVSAGASFDERVAMDFHRLGFTILQGYGLTETSGAATVTRFEDNKVGSVGTPLNGIDVTIDEPNSEGIGEVLIRGPVVMSGYHHNPDANNEAFTSDRRFRSGDLGRFDKHGHLYIVGRKKDVIALPSGKNVFPEDVEVHYEQSRFVSEVCVLGISDDSNRFARAEKLCAVVVPNFEYLKAQHIGNAREPVVFELENLGRDLPEYQRVHDFVLRAEPLPRTSTRKLRRFELRSDLEVTRARQSNDSESKTLVQSEADLALMDSPGGRAVVGVVKQQAREIEVIHPEMNFEIDLGLDSLARAECFASVEQRMGIELTPDEATAAQTVGELARLANSKAGDGTALVGPSRKGFHWHDVLSEKPEQVEAAEELLQRNSAVVLLAYLVLRTVFFVARLFFHMEVKGREVLTELEPPYLICPNHQSYIDPFLVCSTYPRSVLRSVFHVGASMYFTNALMAQLARLINVVPIDPDLQLLRAMRMGAAGLRAGKILNIYPEGQRSFDGDLLEFKKGAAVLATELNLPIVPVALDGPYGIWPRKSWRFRLAKVKIEFGEPMYAESFSLNEADEDTTYERVTAELRRRIQKMLDDMRR